MDGEANLPAPPLPKNFNRPTINSETTSSSHSSSSSFSSSSPPNFLRHVQAAFKRHRSLGVMETNSIKPRRMLVPERAPSRTAASEVGSPTGIPLSKDSIVQKTKNPVTVVRETQEDASITPPSIASTATNALNVSFDAQRDELKSVCDGKENKPLPSLNLRDQFLAANDAVSQGADDRMATGLDNLSTHMSSLALTEMEWHVSNQVEASTITRDDSKHRTFQNVEPDINFRPDGAISSLAKRTTVVQNQLHQLRNFLSQPATQSSTAGPSCATTTSIHFTSAPMLNSRPYCSHLHAGSGSHVVVEHLRDCNMKPQPVTQVNREQLSHPSPKDTCGLSMDHTANATQTSSAAIDVQIKENHMPGHQYGSVPKEISILSNPSNMLKPNEEKGLPEVVMDVQSQAPLSKDLSSEVKSEPSKLERDEKVASSKAATVARKRNYDPDLFFKVNGKLYQRLGKIGSGGSSEVHKVISSDCTIYALKKVKLKGRDYTTAYGFCQEIVYLNKLKGTNNIIQLVDYEVTDKALLCEVMNGCMTNKEGKVKDDGYIYMVLEYGEIDLARMLSQKWKEMDCSNQTIDENWLRFYWQQILQAVNTIHEERIVHSDLKPANFLLVKGSLKLIDFGIARAIMSDTTNIQRDSQVGTLSYMSPEAFMCNEKDANGNTIKCGRPSDIWSLGCILYQMVYGRTPFSEYKTFWAKFKVMTDPNHEITYEPVSNPLLLDLMKKCLAWDRNERWKIPQLRQHPFLVPALQHGPSLSQDRGCKLLQLVAESCAANQEASKICSQLLQLLREPVMTTSRSLMDQQYHLISHATKLCLRLQGCLATSKRAETDLRTGSRNHMLQTSLG